MLERLRDVGWNRLTHAYGPADDTPTQVERLLSPDPTERTEARQTLVHTLCHQGSRYTATAAAVPFLFEMLESQGTPDRDKLIGLLVSFAVGYTEEYLPTGIEPDAAFAAARDVTPAEAGPEHYDDYEPEVANYWEREAYQAVLAGIERVRILAAQDSGATQRAALRGLAWFPAEGRLSRQVIREIAEPAADEDLQTDALLALGLLDRAIGETGDSEWMKRFCTPNAAFPVRTAAAISLAVIYGPDVPDAAVTVLLESLCDVDNDRIYGPELAWFMGSFISHASAVLQFLAMPPEEPLMSTLCRATETVDGWPSLQVWHTLLATVFRDGEGTRFESDPSLPAGGRAVYRDAEQMTAEQRRAIASLLRSPYWATNPQGFGAWEEALWMSGLPTRREELERLLTESNVR